MKTYFVWPVVIALVGIGINIYYRFVPCDSGLFIGFCGLGEMLLYSMLAESVLVYLLLAGTLAFILRKKKTKMTGIALGAIGVLSMGIVFGGSIVSELSMPDWIAYPFILISYPFMMAPFLFVP